jgi:hypothetical protein
MMPDFVNKHHLIPKEERKKHGAKSFGVKNKTIRIHRFCHTMIHIFFDNKQLARKYNTLKQLKDSNIVKRYIEHINAGNWIFYINSKYAHTEAQSVIKSINAQPGDNAYADRMG